MIAEVTVKQILLQERMITSCKLYSFTAYFSKAYLSRMASLSQLVMWLQDRQKRKTENTQWNEGCSFKLQTQKTKLNLMIGKITEENNAYIYHSVQHKI